jgi:trimeric autotransporter adhesin
MASTYVNDLRLNEMATGDASGTWGTVTNANLELIGEALGYGTEAITTNADTHTSTVADGATDPARAMFIKYTGTLDSTCTITIAPNTLNRLHFIHNATSGSQSIIIKQGSGATITIPTGDTKAVYLDGAGSGAAVTDAFASLSVVDLKVQDDLSFTSDSAVVSFGADADTTLTHTDGSGLTLNGTNKLMFNDASQFIQGASATVLDIAATDEIELTATLIDVVGNQTVSGTLGVTGIATFTDDIIIGDGKTIGSASDVDAMTIASNGQVTFTQTLIGTALDISGDIDVDGTTNLDVVDVDGAVNFAADVTFADGADIITASAGTSNFRAGVNAGNSIESGGNYNTVVGDEAGTAITTGDGVSGVAASALGSNTTGNYNTAVGTSALRANTTAANNTAVGYQSLYANTEGTRNNALGNLALAANTTGDNNTALGSQALQANTTADDNTAVGYASLNANTTGANNTAVGKYALLANTTASYNTAVGTSALITNTTGAYNTAVGYQSLYANATGNESTAMGYLALYNNTAHGNTSFGSNSSFANTSGSLNVAVGGSAFTANTTGGSNTAVGHSALGANTTASYNTAVGFQSLYANTTGEYNTAVGKSAGAATTTGGSNTFVGGLTGVATTTGLANTAIGMQALTTNTTGGYNVAVGKYALVSNTTASNNTAVGYSALNANTTGTSNVAIGFETGDALTTGEYNTAVGAGSLTTNSTGINNVAVGTSALGASTGDGNTAVGLSAGGAITSGQYNTALGLVAMSAGAITGNYNVAIGYNAHSSTVSVSNEFTLGASNIDNLRCADTSISALSDSRDKTNIVDIPLGLTFINTVRPVSFDWDARDGSRVGKKDFGFIAQELKVAEDATDYANHMRLVHDNNPDKLEADPMKMFPILVKAVQELSAQVTALTARITTLEG